MANITFDTVLTGEGYQVQVGMRWQEFNRRDQLVIKEKLFTAPTMEQAERKLERFCAKLEERASFYDFVAWL